MPTPLSIPLSLPLQIAGPPDAAPRLGMGYPIHAGQPTGTTDGRIFMFPKLTPLLLLGDLVFGPLPFALIVLLTMLLMHGRRPQATIAGRGHAG